VGDILDQKERHTKFSNMDFIGPLFLGMLMNFAKDTKHARRQEIYLEGIKCLCIMCIFVKFLMYAVLILWDLFPVLLVLLTFLYLLTMYLSRLKLWLLELMILKPWRNMLNLSFCIDMEFLKQSLVIRKDIFVIEP